MMLSIRYLVVSLAAWTILSEEKCVEAAAVTPQKRFDHMDPISHASQAFFQVAAKAAGARLNRRSVVIPSDGDDGKYVVSSRGGDPEGVVEVVTSEHEKMGDLWYDDDKATMFVSTSNHTTFQLHCAPDMHCQLLTLMYDDATVVSRCMTYNQAGDGAMTFDVCTDDGSNQTFLYEKSSGVVRPLISNSTATASSSATSNSTTTFDNSTMAATGQSIEEEIMHEDVMPIGARADLADGATNVTLVFVPDYPNAPSMKQAHSLASEETEDVASSSASASLHTVTETVTVTASASPSMMEAAAATTSSVVASSSSDALSSSAAATPSPSVADAWEVEIHAVAHPSVTSEASSSSAIVSSSAPSPSSAPTVNAAAIASSIAGSGSQASTTPSATSSSPVSETSPSSMAEAKERSFTIRADRYW